MEREKERERADLLVEKLNARTTSCMSLEDRLVVPVPRLLEERGRGSSMAGESAMRDPKLSERREDERVEREGAAAAAVWGRSKGEGAPTEVLGVIPALIRLNRLGVEGGACCCCDLTDSGRLLPSFFFSSSAPSTNSGVDVRFRSLRSGPPPSTSTE